MDKVAVVVRVYDEDPVAEFEVSREKTLSNTKPQTNAHLHKTTQEVLPANNHPVRVSSGQIIIFDPPCSPFLTLVLKYHHWY